MGRNCCLCLLLWGVKSTGCSNTYYYNILLLGREKTHAPMSIFSVQNAWFNKKKVCLGGRVPLDNGHDCKSRFIRGGVTIFIQKNLGIIPNFNLRIFKTQGGSWFLGSVLPQYMALSVMLRMYITFVKKILRSFLSKLGGWDLVSELFLHI